MEAILGFESQLDSLGTILDSSPCDFSGDLAQEKTAGFFPWAAALLPTLSCLLPEEPWPKGVLLALELAFLWGVFFETIEFLQWFSLSPSLGLRCSQGEGWEEGGGALQGFQ